MSTANNIAKYLKWIAGNESEISEDYHKKGYEEGKAEGYDHGYNDGYTDGINRGIEQGKQAEYDAFWDAYQENGNRTSYNSAFQNAYWSGYAYNPKYPITPTASNGCMNLFAWNTRITDTKVPITISGDCSYLFAYNYALKRVPKLIFNGVTKVTSAFDLCSELEELYCEGVIDVGGINLKDSTKLSKDSFISIMKALSVDTMGLSATFSKKAVDSAFQVNPGEMNGMELVEEEAVIGSGSYEWLKLIETRPNWCINLVN